jgi:hypothetical protein
VVIRTSVYSGYSRLTSEQPKVAMLLQHAILHNETHSALCQLQTVQCMA